MGARTIDTGRLALVAERCYDAVVLPGLWRPILQEFAEAANATGLISFQHGRDSQKSMFLASPSLDESLDVYVKEGWFARNTRIPRALRVSSPDRLVSDKDILSVDGSLDAADKAWRHDFLQRQGLGWFAGTDFFYSGGTDRVGIAIERSFRIEPFQTAELDLLYPAFVHLRRAMMLAPGLEDVAAKGLLAGLETTGQAAALLDRAGRVILLNAHAEKLLGQTVLVRGGRLRAATPPADKRLQRFVAGLVRQGARCDEAPIDFVTLPQATGRPLIVRGTPITPIGADLFQHAQAFVTFAEVGAAEPLNERILREVFELTAAEAKVAMAVAEGKDLGDVAARYGVSISTVRSHLKAIFAKTGTGRQPALAALISGQAFRV